jgi:hypothetical protein
LFALTLALLGCSDPKDTADSAEPVEPCDACVLSDSNNFSYSVDLDVARISLAELADVTVDWSGLTTNFYGLPMDPAVDVEEAWLVVFLNATADEIEADLAADTLDQSDVTVYVTCESEEARCALSEFNIFGTYLDVQDYFTPDYGTWLVTLLAADRPGYHSLIFLEPDPSSSATTARFEDGATTLDAEVDLHSLAPIYLYEGAGASLDWSGLTVDGLGNEASVHKLDQLLLAHYSEDIPALEDRFFELWDIADERWELDIGERTSLELTELEGFAGVSGEGTWLLGLFCSTCENPAPRFMTELRLAP